MVKFSAMIWFLMCAFLTSVPADAQNNTPAADQNWVALNIFDSFYPMTTAQDFPQVLSSLEVIYELYTKRDLGRDIERAFGELKHGDHWGSRSREGHFTIWIHLSDRFLKNHPVDRNDLGSQIFMFPDRETDIFTGWSGSVNLGAMLTQGVQGLATPTQTGPNTYDGNFQNFLTDIAPMGDADYEGGWYMSDDQAAKILTAFKTYPGITSGYTFMSLTSARPNFPYDPAAAQLGNGYNCGDFAFYALNTAGVISKDESESLKTELWYPEYYFDHALPLQGVGAKAAAWLEAHPSQKALPNSEMDSIAWEELFFGPTGLEFFDKASIVQAIAANNYKVVPARIWDQAHPIAWLKARNEFPSKGIWTELLPAVLSGAKITSPVRTVKPDAWNRFVLSKDYQKFQEQGNALAELKYKKANIDGVDGEIFFDLYDKLKTPFCTVSQ